VSAHGPDGVPDVVRSVADLKRSSQEAAMARGLPGQLKALQPAPHQTQ